MCINLDKIKICTCKASSIEKLQNYWVLYRRNKDKNIMMVGELMLPSFEWFNPDKYLENFATLEKRVNEDDVFDVPIVFKAKDVLKLIFNNNDNNSKRSTYNFKYFKKQWIKTEIDVFDLMGRFDKVNFGKIGK